MLAQAEERQAGFGQNRRGDGQRCLHDQWRHHVWQYVTQDDPAIRQTDGARTFEVIFVLDRQHLAAGQSGKDRHRGQADGDHRVGQAGAEKGAQSDGQHQKRAGQQRFHDLRNDHVQLATEVPGQQAQRHADEHGDGYRNTPGQQRAAGAIQQAREQIAPQFVGAHPVDQRGGLAYREEVGFERIVRRNPGRQNGRQDKQQQHRRAKHRAFVGKEFLQKRRATAGQDRAVREAGNSGHQAVLRRGLIRR